MRIRKNYAINVILIEKTVDALVTEIEKLPVFPILDSAKLPDHHQVSILN